MKSYTILLTDEEAAKLEKLRAYLGHEVTAEAMIASRAADSLKEKDEEMLARLGVSALSRQVRELRANVAPIAQPSAPLPGTGSGSNPPGTPQLEWFASIRRTVDGWRNDAGPQEEMVRVRVSASPMRSLMHLCKQHPHLLEYVLSDAIGKAVAEALEKAEPKGGGANS